MEDNIVVFSGGFDPIHSGHIQCIDACREFGRVILALNSDDWLTRKKGMPFMPFNERYAVLKQFKQILQVIPFDDSDNTACDAIQYALDQWKKNTIIFANGGDRTSINIPEMERFKNNPRVKFVFGVGGDYKKNSSSSILKNWKSHTEKRLWGDSITYYDATQAKIKKLILEPSQAISMQYHNSRSELWFVENGTGMVTGLSENKEVILRTLSKNQYFHVELGSWHRIKNMSNTSNLEIIEIQYGSSCKEEDIVRNVDFISL